MFQEKDFSHECEAKDVSSIVIQIWAPFMQRVYCLRRTRLRPSRVHSLLRKYDNPSVGDTLVL